MNSIYSRRKKKTKKYCLVLCFLTFAFDKSHWEHKHIQILDKILFDFEIEYKISLERKHVLPKIEIDSMEFEFFISNFKRKMSKFTTSSTCCIAM